MFQVPNMTLPDIGKLLVVVSRDAAPTSAS
jgi:hypothetical protein